MEFIGNGIVKSSHPISNQIAEQKCRGPRWLWWWQLSVERARESLLVPPNLTSGTGARDFLLIILKKFSKTANLLDPLNIN